ncbi:MAG: Rap1a/Tai family immunity protein [Alphaproteobacteria bacterium]
MMMVLTLLVGTILAPSVSAEPFKAMDLVGNCKSIDDRTNRGGIQDAYNEGYKDGNCWGYLQGVLEGFNFLGPMPGICIPAGGITFDQIRLVYLKWATEHPEKLHENARLTVYVSMAAAFPCAETPAPKKPKK